MGADITQLCGLIVEPAEPLALRLSSNLMVGVARQAYTCAANMNDPEQIPVKHDIFLGDINACFVSIKKAIRDLHALSASSAHLQMGQPIVRPDAVTVQLDPAMALGLNLDDFLGDWHEDWKSKVESIPRYSYQTALTYTTEEDGSDEEYGKPRKKSKPQDKRPPPHSEIGKATRHTLDESLEQMMSGSFDMSFPSDVQGEQEFFSSQIDAGFDFGDSEDFGLGDIGDELAKELGEGWTSALVQPKPSAEEEQQLPDQIDTNIDFGQGDDFMLTGLTQLSPDPPVPSDGLTSRLSPSKKRNFDTMTADILPQSPSLWPHVTRTPTPPWAINTEVFRAENALAELSVPSGEAGPVPRKTKRLRIQLDARIELTDEELRTARAQYVEGQEARRREIEEKRLEKEGARLISQMLYGVPPILKAPTLVDFWTDNFKVLVEARSGTLHIKTTGEYWRRRQPPTGLAEELLERENVYETHEMGMRFTDDLEGYQEPRELDITRQRSSEEPGQARHASIGSFPTGSAFDLGRNVEIGSGSQKSSLFPWDNAGLSSSVAGAPFDMGSGRISIGHDDVRLKDASMGRTSGRGSSLVPSQLNSGPGTLGLSPGTFEKIGSQINDSFEFDVPALGSPMRGNPPGGGAEPDLIPLERNSLNFLEYLKMQLQAVQRPSDGVAFGNVAPRETSTPHVAAAAFYHCLVLATKGILRINQVGTYGEIIIKIA
ncbi:hypothetical protein BJV78DRAFT_1277705 [Lactifluus subvellereus]|nr:hypothetical protein BJV78DRAFT_1277705 [Lactifluus subvellereus]